MQEPTKMKCDKCGKKFDVPLMGTCRMLVNMVVCINCCLGCYYNTKGKCTFKKGGQGK